MPRQRGQRADIRLLIKWTPAEFIALEEAAQEEGVSKARYIKEAVCRRYAAEHPERLPFGEAFRL